jgi:hypothetical protein
MFTSHIYAEDTWKYIDFDVSMQPEKFPDSFARTRRVTGIDGLTLYNFFKNLYEMHNLTALRKKGLTLDAKIPRIIHQIWIGGSLPEAFVSLCESWKYYHIRRGWLYKLWTDEDVSQLKLYNKKFFEGNKSPGVRSDLMKWEIIEQFGGFYLDVDYECLMPLDDLLCYDFVTAIQHLDTSFVQLGAAFFGAHPHHPILKHCIETIKDDWRHINIPMKTGPIHFTKSFYKVAGKNGKLDIAFPASYFYPLGAQESELQYDVWLEQGAYAVHHWAKSWLPPRCRLEQFKNLNNESALKG